VAFVEPLDDGLPGVVADAPARATPGPFDRAPQAAASKVAAIRAAAASAMPPRAGSGCPLGSLVY
jgi:hypothetical protein